MMEHLKEYFNLFRKIADVIEELQQVQRKLEKMCIEADKEENSK